MRYADLSPDEALARDEAEAADPFDDAEAALARDEAEAR